MLLLSRACRLDHILLETTGLANPAPLASILWLDDQLESEVKLDCIVTVSILKLLFILLLYTAQMNCKYISQFIFLRYL